MGKENRDNLREEEIVKQILKKAESTPVPLSLSPEMIVKRLPEKKPRSLYQKLSPYALAAVACIALVITGNAAVKEYLSGRSVQPISSEYLSSRYFEESEEESKEESTASLSSLPDVGSEENSAATQESLPPDTGFSEENEISPNSGSSQTASDEDGKKHPPENPIIHDPDPNSSSANGPSLGEPPSEDDSFKPESSGQNSVLPDLSSSGNAQEEDEPSKEEESHRYPAVDPSYTESENSDPEPEESKEPEENGKPEESVGSIVSEILASSSVDSGKNQVLASPMGKFMTVAREVGILAAEASPYQAVYDALVSYTGDGKVTVFSDALFEQEKECVFLSGSYALAVVEGETGPALRVYDLKDGGGLIGEEPVKVQLSQSEETASLSLAEVFYQNGILAVVTEAAALSGQQYTAVSFYQFADGVLSYQNTLFQSGSYLASKVYASQLYLVTDFIPVSGYTLDQPSAFMPGYGSGGTFYQLSVNDIDISESGVSGYRVLGAMPMGSASYYVDTVALAGGGKGLYLGDQGIYLFGDSEEKGVPRTVISKYTIDKGAFSFNGETAVYGSMLYDTVSAKETDGSLSVLTQSSDGTLILTRFDPSLDYVGECSAAVDSTVRLAFFEKGNAYYLAGGQICTLSFTGTEEAPALDTIFRKDTSVPFVEGYELELVLGEEGLSIDIISFTDGILSTASLLPKEEGIEDFLGLQYHPDTNLISFTVTQRNKEGNAETNCYLYRYTGGFELVAKVPCGSLYETKVVLGDMLYLVNDTGITAVQISTGMVLWNDLF